MFDSTDDSPPAAPPPELAAFFTPPDTPPEPAPPDPERARTAARAAADRERAMLAAVYSPTARRAEKQRRATLRQAFLTGPLKGVPPLGEAGAGPGGSWRMDLWPPRPRRPKAVPARRGDTYSRRRLIRLVRRFAKARGAQFGILEFCRWSGVATATIYRHVDSWPALRSAAGLPPAMTPPDRRACTLAALLRALHLNRDRARPLTGVELARAAGLSRSVVGAHGGVRFLRDLYRRWVEASETPQDA